MPSRKTLSNKSNKNSTHGLYTEIYIDILSGYKERIKTSANSKETLKHDFYEFISAIMTALLRMFFFSICTSFIVILVMTIIKRESIAIFVVAITTIISSFATIVVSIFKLPKIIAKYLFNKKEDKQMTKVIKNIQKYEVNMFGVEQASEDATANRVYEEDYNPPKASPKDSSAPEDKDIETFKIKS